MKWRKRGRVERARLGFCEPGFAVWKEGRFLCLLLALVLFGIHHHFGISCEGVLRSGIHVGALID